MFKSRTSKDTDCTKAFTSAMFFQVLAAIFEIVKFQKLWESYHLIAGKVIEKCPLVSKIQLATNLYTNVIVPETILEIIEFHNLWNLDSLK